ncbi:MAG: hypothetical protein GX776_05025 [Oxalobacter sp.]|nr:hypothetical protein [Oxalobacter sp.]
MREIRWLEPARESFLDMVEKLAETDIPEAGFLLESTAENLSGLLCEAYTFPSSEVDPTLREIAVKPYCHLLYDATDMLVVIVAALPSRQWWDMGDFLH